MCQDHCRNQYPSIPPGSLINWWIQNKRFFVYWGFFTELLRFSNFLHFAKFSLKLLSTWFSQHWYPLHFSMASYLSSYMRVYIQTYISTHIHTNIFQKTTCGIPLFYQVSGLLVWRGRGCQLPAAWAIGNSVGLVSNWSCDFSMTLVCV